MLNTNDQPEDSGSDDDWDEMEEEESPTKCLFCSEVFNKLSLAILHLKNSHDFDFEKIKEKFKMDEYSYIKVS